MSTEDTINQIMWGAHFCSVERQGESVLLVLKGLSLKDRCFVDFVHKKAIKEAKARGVFTEFELRSRLKAKNLWDETRDKNIDDLFKRMEELEGTLKEQEANSRRYRITSSLIKRTGDMLEKELREKASLFYVTVEQYASEVKNRSVIYCCAYNEFEDKYWENWKDFEKEQDIPFIGNIAEELNKISICETKQIRKIARSPDWRYMWGAAKGNILALFGECVGQFNIDQRNLTYWSQVYDSVYESYERPSNSIIEDDEALDDWFEEQSRKSKKEQLQKGGKSGKLELSEGVRRHGEVFIVTNPYMNPNTPYRDTPDVPTNEEVEELNSSFVRQFKRKEQELIKDKGMVKEQDLRGRDNKISRMTIGSSDAVIGKRNFGGNASGKSKVVPGGTL